MGGGSIFFNKKKQLVTQEKESETQMIYAHIGDGTLEILPENNSSSQALLEILKESDITVDMHDYENFEKVGSLGSTLPTNDERITTQAGDVILYQGNQMLLFTPVVLTVTKSSLFVIRLWRKAGFLAVLSSWHIA